MNSKERREFILKKLLKRETPQKGHSLADELGVTRQVIVKDIAILRAEGKNIIATPEGYIINTAKSTKVKKIIAVSHNREQIEEELTILVKYGVTINDVIVEHPVYGEIKGMLMISTLDDVENFMYRFNKEKAQPISALTGGIHIHTIEADNEELMDKAIYELRKKNFLAWD